MRVYPLYRITGGLLCSAFFLLTTLRAVEVPYAETPLWDGTCHNNTYGDKGLLKLLLLPSATPDKVTGYVSITGFLNGSGNVTGKLSDHGKIDFKSVDPVTGVAIRWQGFVKDQKIAGEYFIDANPSLGVPKQVGEWEVSAYAQKLAAGESRTQQDVEEKFKRHFIFDLEYRLNALEKDSSGKLTSRAQVYFDEIHPTGTALSICVSGANIDWIPGTTEAAEKNIQKIAFDAIIFWQGVVQKEGHTEIRVSFNYALQEVTDFTILSTTGVTKEETKKTAVAVGKLVGALAIKALLSD